MTGHTLVVCDGPLPESLGARADIEILSQAEFASRARSGAWLSKLWGYGEVGMVVPHTWLRPKPLLVVLTLRMLSRGKCWLMDCGGKKTEIDTVLIVRRVILLLTDAARAPLLLREVRAEVASLVAWAGSRRVGRLRRDAPPLYLRTDLWFAAQVGGSVTHMAGVVNHLHSFFERPLVFSPAPNPLLSKDIAWKPLLPETTYWDFREIPALAFSRTAAREVRRVLGNTTPSFIYHRYCLNNYAGVLLSYELSIPLVVEYNGSEVWISENWGKPPAHRELSESIEMLNLRCADLVIVVSEALRKELLARGIAEQKILVNPNGVDVAFFTPEVAPGGLKGALGISGKTVIGFIGTFGPWHGAEVLIRAFATVLERNPRLRGNLALLMIGDGTKRAEAMELARHLGVAAHCVFTGLVRQNDGPRYLACCDILVAPHVPNTDGSEFFGSPTKLFEYMAMGRPVVASRLGQIADIIEHQHTGLLAEPGSTESLADGLLTLLTDVGLRKRLGALARSEAVRKYSWDRHVERIAVALRNCT